MKLLLSQHKFCVHHTTMHHFTVLLFKATCRMHVCLAVTCQLLFWQNDWDLLCATVVTWGWNGYWNESAQKFGPEEEISPTGSWIQDLSVMNTSLYHWAIPNPQEWQGLFLFFVSWIWCFTVDISSVGVYMSQLVNLFWKQSINGMHTHSIVLEIGASFFFVAPR